MIHGTSRVGGRKATAILAVTLLAYQTAFAQCSAPSTTTPRKTIAVIETTNFRIFGIGGLRDPSHIGDDFEALRDRLCRTWLPEKLLPPWSPKCDVVVHATAGSYLRAVGQDQFATAGTSAIQFKKQAISQRRIDIRANQAGWFVAAAPHELTHIIMADEFLGSELPHWADEGMALLADTDSKQSLHLRDFYAAYGSRTMFLLSDFVCQKHYPATARIPVFYGQSISLAKYMIGCKSPAEFVRFLHRIEKVGCDAAIAEIYGFSGVPELERQWLTSVANISAWPAGLASAPRSMPTRMPPRP